MLNFLNSVFFLFFFLSCAVHFSHPGHSFFFFPSYFFYRLLFFLICHPFLPFFSAFCPISNFFFPVFFLMFFCPSFLPSLHHFLPLFLVSFCPCNILFFSRFLPFALVSFLLILNHLSFLICFLLFLPLLSFLPTCSYLFSSLPTSSNTVQPAMNS